MLNLLGVLGTQCSILEREMERLTIDGRHCRKMGRRLHRVRGLVSGIYRRYRRLQVHQRAYRLALASSPSHGNPRDSSNGEGEDVSVPSIPGQRPLVPRVFRVGVVDPPGDVICGGEDVLVDFGVGDGIGDDEELYTFDYDYETRDT
jgi:hypothetical protein